MKRFLYVPLFFLVGLLACQKPTEAVNPVDTTKPSDTTTHTSPNHSGVVYEHGTPVGQPTQKTIGLEGGTMTSSDGTLAMTIPAGAVSKATTFTMQPVTPTLPGLLGGQSFRLLPEGQTFAQPITLQYKYNVDSLDGTSAQALFMAYQGSDGYWKALLNTELDETAQTLTVSTKHFSDWGAFAEYTLEAKPDVLFPGQTAQLTLSGYWRDMDIPPLTHDELEIYLSQQKTLDNPANIRNWRVIGKGHIDAGVPRTSATYSAPANMAQGRDLVAVDVYNILPANVQPRKGDIGKAVLMKAIYIEGTYFRATVNGQLYDSKDFFGSIDALGISIGGGLSNGNVLIINIHSVQLKSGTFTYSAGTPDVFAKDGKVDVSLTAGGTEFVSWYDTCDSEDLIGSSGSVNIGSVEYINGLTYARGSLTSTVYYITGNCPGRTIKTRKISVEFRVLVSE